MKQKSFELLDGELHTFGPLNVEEMEDVANIMRAARIHSYHAASPKAPMYAEVNARALAIIQCAAVGVEDVRYEWSGKPRFAFYSAKRGGSKLSEKELVALLPCDDNFWREMTELSGYQWSKPLAVDADPTKTSESTSPDA